MRWNAVPEVYMFHGGAGRLRTIGEASDHIRTHMTVTGDWPAAWKQECQHVYLPKKMF